MSNASMSEEDECHVFGTHALWEKEVTLTRLLELRGIHGVVKLLAKLADKTHLETQDHNDDLICMVLERAEKQIGGLVLSQLEGQPLKQKANEGPVWTSVPAI